jgi:hypothetical protein
LFSIDREQLLSQMKIIQLPDNFDVTAFTDVKLTFIDSTSQITINAHCFILACRSLYFNTLFTFNENIHRDTFTIPVDDVSIVSILIRSFYGEVIEMSPIELLMMTKCKSYFCVNIEQLIYMI